MANNASIKRLLLVMAVSVICIITISLLFQGSVKQRQNSVSQSKPQQRVNSKPIIFDSNPKPSRKQPGQFHQQENVIALTEPPKVADKLAIPQSHQPSSQASKKIPLKKPCGTHMERNSHFVDRNFWHGITPAEMLKRSEAIKRFIDQDLPMIQYRNFEFEGRGVIYTITDRTYVRALASIKILKLYLKSRLPVQAWFMTGELSDKQIRGLREIGVEPMDLLIQQQKHQILEVFHVGHDYGNSRNYHIKSLVLILSKFKEILYLDSDNLPLRDPEMLFGRDEFTETGALFWPDFWKFPIDNPIWQVTNQQCVDEFEFETGQIVLDKERAWEPLLLSLFLQKEHEFYFKILLGDKDTFRMAWKILNQHYHIIGRPLAIAGRVRQSRFCGHTMVQFGPDDKIMFAHTSVMKGTSGILWGSTFDAIQYMERATILKSHDSDKGPVLTASYPVAVEYSGGAFKTAEQGGVGLETRPNPCLEWTVYQLNITTTQQVVDSYGVNGAVDSYKVTTEAWSSYADGELSWLEGQFFGFGGTGQINDGTCGFGNIGDGKCQNADDCCSPFGWCGKSIDHCAADCQGGPCFATRQLPQNPGETFPYCGEGNVGFGICKDDSQCCSRFGWCGNSLDHCKRDVCLHGPCLAASPAAK